MQGARFATGFFCLALSHYIRMATNLLGDVDFFFSSRRRHTRLQGDWSSDVCSSDLTVVLRNKFMPLFQAHHVRVVFSGHEHLFEHWIEHYTDASGTHRMDLVVSGGGGAPLYFYTGEPNLDDYLKADEASKVKLDHLVKPGVDRGSNPFH